MHLSFSADRFRRMQRTDAASGRGTHGGDWGLDVQWNAMTQTCSNGLETLKMIVATQCQASSGKAELAREIWTRG
jgi:hypothetical protein